MSETGDHVSWLSNQLDWFQHITPESVEFALRDFELPTERSSRWLAGSIRKAFFCSIGTEEEIDEYPGQHAVRREIQSIADAIANAKTLFAARSSWAESVFRQYSRYDDQDERLDTELPKSIEFDALDRLDAVKKGCWVESSKEIASGSADWRKFRRMVCGMLELEDYMRAASDALCNRDDPPRWRSAEKRKRRLAFARELALIFEKAYGREATINNWPDENGEPRLGPWANFFNRIACLTLRIEKVPNLTGLLKEARRERIEEVRVNLIRAIHPLGYPWRNGER
ncbi:hypothetical protein HFP51_07710 [Parasphingopyxis sp. CP4]|uniref:hypothetical protein n=1 Tax=Parasphingopyxis sp. CP4 TaxID=2724527 RepID=UPI0015A25E30|nr:hypothetical protein [Parasphingopyxis sp. CP4]QLC22074.1 hypothetical protein HFP51_07710 [Parasphingopyxis sp. CP4]